MIYEAVDRVSTVSSEKTRSIKLVVFENNISLSSSSAETGTGAEDIKIKYSGEKLEVGYNARYLMEIINQQWANQQNQNNENQGGGQTRGPVGMGSAPIRSAPTGPNLRNRANGGIISLWQR